MRTRLLALWHTLSHLVAALSRPVRAGVTVALIAFVVLVGALTLYAGHGIGSASANLLNSAHLGVSAGAAADTTPTATPVPTPTDTPVSTPTATPTPMPPPPAPTATPVPVLVTFTCASGQLNEPGSYRLSVCISSQPGSQVSLDATFCGSPYGSTEGISPLPADGTWSTNAWIIQTSCSTPFTVTLTARGTSGDGRPLSGSTSFTVQ